MPWTTADVDRFKKGLADEQKARWVAIANGTLADCMKQDDADELDCEVKAVRVANATVEGKEKAAALAMADTPNPLTVSDHRETINIALAETAEDGEYQLAFPIGLFKTSKYGEVIVTRTFAERMVENWKGGALGNRNVFMDTEHDFGEANAWARDARVSDDGLEIAWDFTARGRELVADRRYRYYSAAIGWAVDTETGDEHFPVLHAVSLTNMPVMNRMPEAHLSDPPDGTGTKPAHGDGEQIHEEESMKTLAEILTALLALSDEERGEAAPDDLEKVVKAFGIDVGTADRVRELQDKVSVSEEKITLLHNENREMSEKLSAYKDAERKAARDKVIEKALDEGRILPKDREAWEGIYDKDPEGTEKLLSTKGKEIDFDRHGTSRGKEIAGLSEEERETLAKLGITDEDVKQYGGDA